MSNNWQPSASINTLQTRAKLIANIRAFFAERDVLEVDTPLMCHTSVTDPFIESIPTLFKSHVNCEENYYYLQTSPEYAMKRLLAAGSGSIYQICKAFRQSEVGRIHNPEFTMLEWYRIGFDHHQLMDEMDELLQFILKTPPALRETYARIFKSYLQIDAHHANIAELAACAKKHNVQVEANIHDRDTWLMLLFTHCIEPKLGQTRPCFIYDFPASQAALARIQASNPPIASRFEVYFYGTELANGFHELQNAAEQRQRFENNLAERKKLGLSLLPIDENFLAALQAGLPNCAGVALGIDRLLMLANKADQLADILSFDINCV